MYRFIHENRDTVNAELQDERIENYVVVAESVLQQSANLIIFLLAVLLVFVECWIKEHHHSTSVWCHCSFHGV
jgi:hypothetical protein